MLYINGNCYHNYDDLFLAVHSYVKDGAVVDSQHVTPAVHFSDKHRETVDASPSGTCVNGIEGISGNILYLVACFAITCKSLDKYGGR